MARGSAAGVSLCGQRGVVMAVISTKEAARRLGVTDRRVRAMIAASQLPAQRIGRDWLLDEDDVERLRRMPRPPGRRPRKG